MASLLSQTPVVILARPGQEAAPALSDSLPATPQASGLKFLQTFAAILRSQGARLLVLCVADAAQGDRAGLQDLSVMDFHIEQCTERGRSLGTGGALRRTLRFFQPRALVLRADAYLDIDHEWLLAQHQILRVSRQVRATVALVPGSGAHRFGSVELDGEGKLVTGFPGERAPGDSGWFSTGVQVIERDLLEPLPEDTPCSLEKQVLPGALRTGARIAGCPCSARLYDLADSEEQERFLKNHADARRNGNRTTGRAA